MQNLNSLKWRHWFHTPILQVNSFRRRLMYYLIILTAVTLSVPLLHLYMSVPLSGKELAIHAMSLCSATLLIMSLVEVAVTLLVGSTEWGYSLSVFKICIYLTLGFLFVIWASSMMQDFLPSLKTISDKHVHAGYENMTFKLTPVLLVLIAYVIMRAKKEILNEQVRELVNLNHKMQERSHVPIEDNPDKLAETKTNHAPLHFVHNDIELIIQPENIIHIQAEENYCQYWIIPENNAQDVIRCMKRTTLRDAIELLPKQMFAQTHRSHVVNLNHVRKIQRKERSYFLILKNDKQVPVSRSRFTELRQRLE